MLFVHIGREAVLLFGLLMWTCFGRGMLHQTWFASGQHVLSPFQFFVGALWICFVCGLIFWFKHMIESY